MIDEWLVVANGPQKIEDMRKASEDQLCGSRANPIVRSLTTFQPSTFLKSSNLQFYQWDHTIGPEVTMNPYHINIVRGPLTRNIAAQFDDLREEMIHALDDLIPCRDGGELIWTMLSRRHDI